MAHTYGGPPPPPPHFIFQYNSAATIERIYNLQFIVPGNRSVIGPTAVAIGPYHHGSAQLSGMQEAKSAAVAGFCRAACQPREAVRGKMLSLVGAARGSYAADGTLFDMDDGEFADMMLLDGCFLLQFMVSMCGRRPDGDDLDDPLMSRGEVRRCVRAIARDVMLLENQIPWLVLDSLMQLTRPPAVPDVDRFLALMASAFDIVGNDIDNASSQTRLRAAAGEPNQPPPPHLLGLFYRRQMEEMGAVRTENQGLLRVPIQLASLSSTAVELAEMGIKLAASKTKTFGDMAMSKRRRRRWPLSLFGELSLAPLVLNRLTECWLLNMAAYESYQLQGIATMDGAADSFPVSSYVTLVSLLVNRPEDVQEMRAKGLIVSAFDDMETLGFFKALAPQLNVGYRYYEVFQRLQEYRQERWLWIAVHSFLYNNIKTIVTVFSIVGVLAGLFKTILSVKQPHG
ncbi:hypothetical protein SETIT_8G039200v2 [Setaria italica]|uniref:Uncharacterized protein n=2 Tax=Setaria italica TaxID=4555 RepID=A0A368S3V1_SETIT|nr:UPF0481 protein At3g47200 [Setaria italica]RCV37137.1 hypothetical protein SETIT_8G039200v2 [Setaria italica]